MNLVALTEEIIKSLVVNTDGVITWEAVEGAASYNVYVNDDFFSLIALIKQNSEVFDFLPANEVLQKICLEIFEDYLNFRK